MKNDDDEPCRNKTTGVDTPAQVKSYSGPAESVGPVGPGPDQKFDSSPM